MLYYIVYYILSPQRPAPENLTRPMPEKMRAPGPRGPRIKSCDPEACDPNRAQPLSPKGEEQQRLENESLESVFANADFLVAAPRDVRQGLRRPSRRRNIV